MTKAAFAFALVLLAAPGAAEGQPTTMSRIGVLSGASAAPPPLLDAFQQTLRDLGHHEGRTILIEYRSAEAKPEQLPALAEELVRLNVDVIVAINTPASQAAKAATSGARPQRPDGTGARVGDTARGAPQSGSHHRMTKGS